MRVYWNMAIYEMKYALRYRANIFFNTMSEMVAFFAFFLLWRTIFSINGTGWGYTFREMATYYLISNFFFHHVPVCWNEFSWFVREGIISNFLTRPLNLYYLYYSRTFGAKWAYMTSTVIFMTSMYLISGNFFILPHNIAFILLAILFWIGGGIIYYSASFWVEALSFWFEEVSGYSNILFVIKSFLSGYLIPLNIVPFKKFLIYQPFNYVAYFPTRVFMGKVSYHEILYHFVAMLLWILTFWGISLYVLKKGLIKYSAPGG